MLVFFYFQVIIYLCVCYYVALKAIAIFYAIQDFTLIALLLKLASPALILFNIQIVF